MKTEYLSLTALQRHAANSNRFTVFPENYRDIKEHILADLTEEYAGALNPRAVRQVVCEANALAATTAFPVLFFPTLAEEKVRNASEWAVRHQPMREQAFALAA
jgi:hypothetical protein